MVHDVIGPQRRPAHALATAPLRTVLVGVGPLRVPAAGDRHHDVGLGDQVLVGDIAVKGDDLGPPGVAVLAHDLGKLGTDDLPLLGGRVKDGLEAGDPRLQVGALLHQLLPLKGGQLAKLHVEDRPGLDLVEPEQPHQSLLRHGRGLRGPDERDDLVDRVDRREQRGDDMQPLLCLAQPEPGAPLDDLDLVRDPVADHLVEAESARHAVHQGQHDHAERVLELGVLVEVVEHDLCDRVPPQHDHEPLAGPAARLVPHVGDAGQAALPDKLGDLRRQVVRVDLEGELLDDQAAASLDLLVLHDGPHGDRAAPGPVRLADPAPPDDLALGREVGSVYPFHEPVKQVLVGMPDRRVRIGGRICCRRRGCLEPLVVLQVPVDRGGDLPQVVRRDLGGHPDGDALRAVDEQVGVPGRQHNGFPGPAVVVRPEIDGLLVDVPQHLHRQRVQAALGVPHGGGRVVAGGAEVALPVDQRHPHRPGLRHPHERVVNRAVAVRMVVAHHLADHAGALEVPSVGPEATVVHRVENAGVHRLEPVAHVGQRPADDDRHRVVDVTALHLDLDVDRLCTVVLSFGRAHHLGQIATPVTR